MNCEENLESRHSWELMDVLFFRVLQGLSLWSGEASSYLPSDQYRDDGKEDLRSTDLQAGHGELVILLLTIISLMAQEFQKIKFDERLFYYWDFSIKDVRRTNLLEVIFAFAIGCKVSFRASHWLPVSYIWY